MVISKGDRKREKKKYNVEEIFEKIMAENSPKRLKVSNTCPKSSEKPKKDIKLIIK